MDDYNNGSPGRSLGERPATLIESANSNAR
jgi:hypothetical protein